MLLTRRHPEDIYFDATMSTRAQYSCDIFIMNEEMAKKYAEMAIFMPVSTDGIDQEKLLFIDNDAVGILIDENNRLLVQAVANNQFYCLPGGRVEIGESSNEALARELHEELGFPVEVGQPVFFIENFFVSARTNILAHEIGIYFMIKSKFAPKEDWEFVENDKGVLKTLPK